MINEIIFIFILFILKISQYDTKYYIEESTNFQGVSNFEPKTKIVFFILSLCILYQESTILFRIKTEYYETSNISQKH